MAVQCLLISWIIGEGRTIQACFNKKHIWALIKGREGDKGWQRKRIPKFEGGMKEGHFGNFIVYLLLVSDSCASPEGCSL